MKLTRRIGTLAATFGLAVAGLTGPLASASSASTSAPAVTEAAADNWYGPYRDLGTCNYWKYAMNAAGVRTTSCHQPFLDGTWWFIAY
jgi:hypothetical protein